jgi:FkbM family methyltransferase
MKKIISGINKVVLSDHQLMVTKWCSDGGDYKLRFNYELNEESVILDLGGYQGQWASDLFSRYRCNIFIFEPVIDFSDQIKERFVNNNQIKVLPFGLGKFSRSEIIHLSADGSSTFGKSTNREKIEIVDVKDWIDTRKIGEIALIKINIEGGEYELLDRLIETELIKNIENIQVQFHNISKDSRSQMKRIQKALSHTHMPTYQYEFVWENWVRNTASPCQ